MNIIDSKQRQQALDPTQSFIVQAPAGSGKTHLLVQRYLTLLATVKQPESIIAITFTRKAASEMRQRILQALEDTEEDRVNAVLQQDKKQNWCLKENPNRLRIMTIDALCASITRQMPILANFGASPEITDNPTNYYRDAIQRLLTELDVNNTWHSSLEKLLLHTDNNYIQLERLLIDLLSRRDQWLPHIINHNGEHWLRQHMEEGLQTLIDETLNTAWKHCSNELKQQLTNFFICASNNLHDMGLSSPINALYGISDFPNPHFDALEQWQALCHMLLTQNNTWRKMVDKRIGFPAQSDKTLSKETRKESKALKDAMLALLEQLKDNDELLIALQQCAKLPPPYYTEKQWDIISALLTVLPVLTAQLLLVFSKQGLVDFCEVSLAALRALGDTDNPTDLSLSLDYKIQHLLVDEFQDTSTTQFCLLERLTNGWQQNDGRTLFLVGDPMQSIYRFRQAEVSLFLQARYFGVGDIKLTPLQLQMNFRSNKTIVNWVNHMFTRIFPKVEDINAGAVSYAISKAYDETETESVVINPIYCDDEATSFEPLVQVIQSLNHANASIAVLVRARSHIIELLPLLREKKIAYQAVEIESLATRSHILDCLALTRAYTHLADRTAWLSILRAPWLGLTLADIYAIAGVEQQLTLWERLLHYESIDTLTHDASKRLKPFLAAFSYAFQNKRRLSLRDSVRGLWLQLGGPACLNNPEDLDDIEVFWDLLEQHESAGVLQDLNALEEEISGLYAQSEQANLQIMTIHKAKGLEFDHVIIPSLESRMPYDPHSLLLWSEQYRAPFRQLLLAPLGPTANKTDKHYQFIRELEQQKTQHESARLLYVAATRAKKSLHLMPSITIDEDQLKTPAKGCLLAHLWPYIKPDIEKQWELNQQSPSTVKDLEEATAFAESHPIRRLSGDWKSPLKHTRSEVAQIHNKPPEPQALESVTASIIGTFIHRLLFVLSQQGIDYWQKMDLSTQYSRWQIALRQLGLPESAMNEAIEKIALAITHCLTDSKAQWIFSLSHREAHSEYSLSRISDAVIHNSVIDRTFVDANNTRWIIDYKTATDTSKLEEYKRQLHGYADIFRQLSDSPIRLGVYFPLIPNWIEWGYNATGELEMVGVGMS